MTFINFKQTNLAKGQLFASLSAAQTTLVLKTGEGDLFPSSFPFMLKIEQYDSTSTLENKPVLKRELLKVTNRVGDTLTIERGAEACPSNDTATTQTTTSFTFDADDFVYLTQTADDDKDVKDELNKKLNISEFQNGSYVYQASSGGTDSYAITLVPAITSYLVGQTFKFMADVANTGACTINVCGLGAITIKKLHDKDLETGDIETNQIVTVSYDGTNFQMDSQIANISNVDIHGQTEKTTPMLPDDELMVYDSLDLSNKKIKYNLINNGLKNYVLGETIANDKVVSLMADGLVYQLLNNKRTLTGAVSGETFSRSCLLPNNKIATVGRTANILKLYIGTINNTTNTITYGTGVQVTTNSTSDEFYIDKVDTDVCVITYYNSVSHDVLARACTISGTVPTIGGETQIVGSGFYYTKSVVITYVSPTKFAIGWIQSNNGQMYCGITVCSVSSTTITVGGSISITTYQVNQTLAVSYIRDNIFCRTVSNTPTLTSSVYAISVSGITPTNGAGVSIGTNNSSGIISSDGINIYVSGSTYLFRFTVSGNTLTQIRAVDSINGYIYLNGSMLGFVSGTSLIRYSVTTTGVIQRNTINYGVSLTQGIKEYSSDYNIIALTSNPSTVYKIANENRGVIGYLSTGGNIGDTKAVIIDNGIISGLSNIVPGEVYYITFATGAIGLSGDMVLGRGISATEIKTTIKYLD